MSNVLDSNNILKKVKSQLNKTEQVKNGTETINTTTQKTPQNIKRNEKEIKNPLAGVLKKIIL